MYTQATRKSLGKFEGNESQMVAKTLYGITMDGGCDDETGSVDEGGWYGLIHGRKFSFIVAEDSQGFFEYAIYPNREAANIKWASIEF